MVYYTAVHFRCRCKVDFGDKVVVVGSHKSLGDWDVKNSHRMIMSSTVEDIWISSFPAYLPLKSYVEYRYAVLNENDEFMQWKDEVVRHVEPTGNEMIVEDDDGYYRSESSSYPKSPSTPRPTAFGVNDEKNVDHLGLNNFLTEPEFNSDDMVYFVSSRLPVQVFRRKDGSFGIRNSNTPLTTMLWELRKRFRNKMKFVGACSINFETESDANAPSAKTDTESDCFHTPTNNMSSNTDNQVNKREHQENGVNDINGSDAGSKLGNTVQRLDSNQTRSKSSDSEYSIPPDEQFTQFEQNEITEFLLKHDCIPVFIPQTEMNKSIKFCKKYMWNLFYNIGLWDITKQKEFDWDLWQSYCKVNMFYASTVSQYLGRSDFVWVHDYKLLMVPQFLSRKCKTANIGVFMHALFPSYTLFACLAVREEILRSMLCADLIGFHFFEFARHFLTSCKRVLGLEYNFSTGGTIGIEYNGRQVMIRMSHANVQADLLRQRISPETNVPELAKQLKEKWPNRFIVSSVDRDVRLSGLLLKFKAFRKFLQNYPYARNKILLVQYICSLDTLWQTYSEAQVKLSHLAQDINDEFHNVHVLLKVNPNSEEKYALFLASDCFMDTCIRGGINIGALEYVYTRKGKPALAIISEFSAFSKTLLSAIRINPWHTYNVMEALDTAMSSDPATTLESCKKDVSYIENNDAVTWVNDFIKELYYSRKKHDMLHTSWGFGKTYKTLSFSTNFQLLDIDNVVGKFKMSKRRLLFLDCEGTLSSNPFDVESHSLYQTDIHTKSTPLPANLTNLGILSKDRNTVIVLISCRTKEVMESWFNSVPDVGLCAERGYYFKLPTVLGREWQTFRHMSTNPTLNHMNNVQSEVESDVPSDSWRPVALKLFEQYVQRTPGSYLESKDSCLVFQFQNSDQEFGIIQANELNSSLCELMSGFPVDVHRGKGYLELRLKGINKGNALVNVVNKYSSLFGDFDFVLCLGDDKSDEESFKALETLKSSHDALKSSQESSLSSTKDKDETSSYISCVVGKRPSKANYYLNDYMEVSDLLSDFHYYMLNLSKLVHTRFYGERFYHRRSQIYTSVNMEVFKQTKPPNLSF
uniref:Trehalose-6-phosphate synthase n=1 Tax=Theileria annulata TaxID=5874 RepID=A0A3B0N6W9_THEAN